MKIKKLTALVCCALALCLGVFLSACDGEEQSKKAFGGQWSILSMEQDGQVTTEEDMALIRSLGLDVTLDLKEDLTATLNIFGSEGAGTWQPETSKKATFTLDGQPIEMTIEDGKLTLVQEASTMIFVRPEELPSTDETNLNEVLDTNDGASNDDAAAADTETSEDTGESTENKN